MSTLPPTRPRQSRFRGTLRHIYINWPRFAWLYGGLILALFGIGAGISQEWPGLILLGLAGLLSCTYFLLAALWATYQLYDTDGLNPHHVLFDLGGMQASTRAVYIDLGARRPAIALAQRLVTGQMIVIDVYSPQWAPDPALIRLRNQAPQPPADPRLVWRTGRIDLLPLPDKSVPVVLLNQVLDTFWQRGDRLALLREVKRVLAPNGRLLLAARCRTQTNGLVLGPSYWQLDTPQQWQHLLQEAGFQIDRKKTLNGLLHCFQASKPTPTTAQQLPLSLEFL